MTTETEKYRAFRNFMVNELGIGRDDIQAWTKEAIAVEVAKIVGQINVEGMVQRTIDKVLHDRYSMGTNKDFSSEVRALAAKQLAERLTIAVRPDTLA